MPRLWVPEGFAYRSFHDTEWPVVLDDGSRLPGSHDGMGAFQAPGGNTILVRNHEVKVTGQAFGPGHVTYDPVACGGATTIEVTRYGEVVRSHTSLSGTHTNCCGGRMPWGTWISCEETVHGPDVAGLGNYLLRERHGFIFEVPAQGAVEPRADHGGGPLRARVGGLRPRRRRAVPDRGQLRLRQLLLPLPAAARAGPVPRRRARHRRRRAAAGARGQGPPAPGPRRRAGARRGLPGHLGRHRRPGADVPVHRRACPRRRAQDKALRHVSDQGRDGGAALFSRLEGSTYRQGVVFFTSTQGGGGPEKDDGPFDSGYGNGRGQIWAYHCARGGAAAGVPGARPGTGWTSRTTSPPAPTAR